MNPILMLLIQMLTQAQQGQQSPEMMSGPPEIPFPATNLPPNDPTAGPPNYQAMAQRYMSGRNI